LVHTANSFRDAGSSSSDSNFGDNNDDKRDDNTVDDGRDDTKSAHDTTSGDTLAEDEAIDTRDEASQALEGVPGAGVLAHQPKNP